MGAHVSAGPISSGTGSNCHGRLASSAVAVDEVGGAVVAQEAIGPLAALVERRRRQLVERPRSAPMLRGVATAVGQLVERTGRSGRWRNVTVVHAVGGRDPAQDEAVSSWPGTGDVESRPAASVGGSGRRSPLALRRSPAAVVERRRVARGDRRAAGSCTAAPHAWAPPRWGARQDARHPAEAVARPSGGSGRRPAGSDGAGPDTGSRATGGRPAGADSERRTPHPRDVGVGARSASLLSQQDAGPHVEHPGRHVGPLE